MKCINEFVDTFKTNVLTNSKRIRSIKLMVLSVIASISNVLVISLEHASIDLFSVGDDQARSESLIRFFHSKTFKQDLIVACIVDKLSQKAL